MQWAIIDTDIYIGHWECGRYTELLATVQRAFNRSDFEPLVRTLRVAALYA